MKDEEIGYASLMLTIILVIPLVFIAYASNVPLSAWIILAIFTPLIFAFLHVMMCPQKEEYEFRKALKQLDESRDRYYALWYEYERLINQRQKKDSNKANDEPL